MGLSSKMTHSESNINTTTLSIQYHYAESSIMYFHCNAVCYCAECRYAECFYAECRYAECYYAECRYAECCYAECRYAECCYA
jgi:hypothetical protein